MSALKQIFEGMNLPAPGEDTDILADDFSLPGNSTGASKLKISVQLGTEGIINLISRRKTGDTKATGTITPVAGASLVDGDYFTLNDGVNPAQAFEFDDDNAFTAGRVQIELAGDESLNQIAYKIMDAINAADFLDITAEVDPETYQVLLTSDTGGEDCNQAVTENVTNAGFTVAGMTGGLDDGETVIPLNGDAAIAEGTPHSEEILISSVNHYNLQLDTDGEVEHLVLALSKEG